jgi:hypothetical protein
MGIRREDIFEFVGRQQTESLWSVLQDLFDIHDGGINVNGIGRERALAGFNATFKFCCKHIQFGFRQR